MTPHNNYSNTNSIDDLQRKNNRIATWIFLAAIIALPLLIYAVKITNQPKPTIKWNENLPNALIQAKNDNKLVLIDFTAKWCPPCKTMKTDVLPTKSVENVIKKHYIPVHVDIDETKNASQWASKYDVQAIPTFIILNSDGDEIDRLQGTSDVSTFVQWLEKYNYQPTTQDQNM